MHVNLTTFDGTESISCEVQHPDRYSTLFSLLNATPQFVARGSGLSYSAASMSSSGAVVLTESFNRILEFDNAAGTIVVEAGARLGKLVDFSIAHGWYPPVLPGHPTITVGGAVAFNVHGKSQFAQGCFDSCVERLWLFHPLHREIECTRPGIAEEKNSDLYELTLGGMGLTGFITKVKLQLAKLGGPSVERRRVKVRNIEDAVETMEELHKSYPILYSWNDLNLGGDRFGQGIVYAEKFSSRESKDSLGSYNILNAPQGRSRPLPLLNNFTAPLMCAIYGTQERFGKEVEVLPVRKATFPINGKEFYFGLFGRPGFREYQMIIPRNTWPETANKIRDVVQNSSCGIALGSLKLFEGERKYLNFTGEGVCLAIDVPASQSSVPLFEKIYAVVLNAGGVINLSKDSRISKQLAQQIFPGYEGFRKELLKFDPKKRCSSSLRTRIGLI